MTDREWFDLVKDDPREAIIVAAKGIIEERHHFGTYRLREAVQEYEYRKEMYSKEDDND